MKAELPFEPRKIDSKAGRALLEARLKKMRRERRWIDQAILALSQLSRARGPRTRRGGRD